MKRAGASWQGASVDTGEVGQGLRRPVSAPGRSAEAETQRVWFPASPKVLRLLVTFPDFFKKNV